MGTRLVYHAVAAGVWELSGSSKLTEKITSYKATPKYWMLQGQKVDVKKAGPTVGLPRPPSLDDMVPLGIPREFTILQLTPSLLKTSTTTQDGRKLTLVGKRRKAHFKPQ